MNATLGRPVVAVTLHMAPELKAGLRNIAFADSKPFGRLIEGALAEFVSRRLKENGNGSSDTPNL